MPPLTTAEAARYLGVHPDTLRLWTRLELVRALHAGRHLRYETADLDAYLRRGAADAPLTLWRDERPERVILGAGAPNPRRKRESA